MKRPLTHLTMVEKIKLLLVILTTTCLGDSTIYGNPIRTCKYGLCTSFCEYYCNKNCHSRPWLGYVYK